MTAETAKTAGTAKTVKTVKTAQRMRRVAGALVALGAALGLVASPAVSSADPGTHQVTYTITTTSGLNAYMYYMAVEPPSQAAYDADSSPYLLRAEAYVSPDAPWVFQTTLTDSTKWAIVSASGGLRVNPEFHCAIDVDGVPAVSVQGGSGVQCALRPW